MKEYNKPRVLRLSDSVWKDFLKLKQKGKDWNLSLRELLDLIEKFSKY